MVHLLNGKAQAGSCTLNLLPPVPLEENRKVKRHGWLENRHVPLDKSVGSWRRALAGCCWLCCFPFSFRKDQEPKLMYMGYWVAGEDGSPGGLMSPATKCNYQFSSYRGPLMCTRAQGTPSKDIRAIQETCPLDRASSGMSNVRGNLWKLWKLDTRARIIRCD